MKGFPLIFLVFSIISHFFKIWYMLRSLSNPNILHLKTLSLF